MPTILEALSNLTRRVDALASDLEAMRQQTELAARGAAAPDDLQDIRRQVAALTKAIDACASRRSVGQLAGRAESQQVRMDLLVRAVAELKSMIGEPAGAPAAPDADVVLSPLSVNVATMAAQRASDGGHPVDTAEAALEAESPVLQV